MSGRTAPQTLAERSLFRLQREAQLLATALTFLSRLPLASHASARAEDLALATRHFPVAGAILGLLLALSLYLLQSLLPASVAVALMLCLSVMLTGAFHEDGLADVADSAGAFAVEDRLQIMRDSRVGTYGALALILAVLVKFSALWELLKLDVEICLMALIAAHVLSRWSSVCLMAREPYARPEAANKVVAEGVGARSLLLATLSAVGLMLPLVLWQGVGVLALFLPALVLVMICGWHFRRVLGGITGDCLGACNQLVEILVLLCVLAVGGAM